jgi:ABC-type transport system involved in multi-copper enzyme maturation permease subunit
LLALHIGVVVLRKHYEFAINSVSEVLTSVFWMLWLVMAPFIGSMAVAEERRLGVMEGQLCLPVSRRTQFAIKTFLTVLLGTFLGGALPMLLEHIAIGFGSHNPMLTREAGIWFPLGVVVFAAGLAFVSFYASTLARNFLQAIGLAVATVVGCALIGAGIANAKSFFGIFPLCPSVLKAVIAVPTTIVTLLWLGYLNFKTSQSGWPLWRRNLIGVTGAALLIALGSTVIYNRPWEVFEPAEPPHGAAKFSLSNTPALQRGNYNGLLVRLPDGRVWFDSLGYSFLDEGQRSRWEMLWWSLVRRLPRSAGPRQFIGGSNWVSVAAQRIDFGCSAGGTQECIVGYLDTVGIQPDGTLWISSEAKPITWTGAKMVRFGDETNWDQVVRLWRGFLLLKKDGTLWQWGTNRVDWTEWRTNWPSVRASRPQQVGTNSDWKEIFGDWTRYARKTDGSTWAVHMDWKTGKDEMERNTSLDQIVPQTFSRADNNTMAYVGKDGTLWVYGRYFDDSKKSWEGAWRFVQAGKETNWVAVAVTWNCTVALKADGSLWKWNRPQKSTLELAEIPPTRLGIHKDWVGLTGIWDWGGPVSLAADGSLWFWPNTGNYGGVFFRAPKQPRLLGNIFSDTH